MLKGADGFGNEYESIEDMWKKELKNKGVGNNSESEESSEEEVKECVGTEQAWYSKQVQYWNVTFLALNLKG